MEKYKIALSFVIDDKAKFIEQGERLLFSLWHVGMLPNEDVDVYVNHPEGMNSSFLSLCQELGVYLVPYTPFTLPNAVYCNKILQLDNLSLFSYDYVVLLDADLFLLESIVPLCRGNGVRAKLVDMPNPPLPIWHSLVGLTPLTDLEYYVSPTFTPNEMTHLYNCNGGLYIARGCDLELLAPRWRYWALFCLDHASTLKRWSHHADQLGFALAMLETQQKDYPYKINFEPLSVEWNFPTHFSKKNYCNVTPCNIKLLHYHSHIDQETGLLKPTGVDWIDKSIMRSNDALTSSNAFSQHIRSESINNSKTEGALLLISFHRSLSSSLARWLHHAGLNMGHYLMPPAVSNPDGHYEDMSLVDLHERLLKLNGVDWRYQDKEEFNPFLRTDLLKCYLQRRADTTKGPYGAKDPRACLFLPAWRKVLGDHGRYLVLLRHWSGSVQSLYRRHAESLAVGEGNAELNASFWSQPELAARMWLAYHRRLLPLLEESPNQCLVVTQQALLGGIPIIEKLNNRFGMALDSTIPSPIRHSLSHDLIEEGVRQRLPPELVEELDTMWQRLLANTDYHADNEAPQWVSDFDVASQSTRALLNLVDMQSDSNVTTMQDIPIGSLQQQLQVLAEDVALPFDVISWQSCIMQEARFVPECWELLAHAQLNRGDALGAEKALAKVLLCGKSPPYLYLLLGTCRESELDYEGAEHYYRQAIARDDTNAIFHVRLTSIWLAQGCYDKAESHLRQALERNPGKPPLIHALVNCLDQHDRTHVAIKLLQETSNELDKLPMLLSRQLASLRLKLAPEKGAKWRLEQVRVSAPPLEVQQLALDSLADVSQPAARRDLARRIVATWQQLGMELPITPSAAID